MTYYQRNRDKILERVKEYYRVNREKILAREHRRHLKNPSMHRAKNLRVKFGLSLEDYDNLWIEQMGLCAICRRKESKRKNDELVVDHDHNTGRIRGLLCIPCNSGIGLLQDNPKILSIAKSYITGRI